MKKAMMIMMAASMFTTSMPAFALAHGDSHDPNDAQCAKECELLLKNCGQDVDAIQQRIKKLKAAIKKQGADQSQVDELKLLKGKLDEANATLKSLEKPGH